MAELSSVYEDIHDRIWEIEKVNSYSGDPISEYICFSTGGYFDVKTSPPPPFSAKLSLVSYFDS